MHFSTFYGDHEVTALFKDIVYIEGIKPAFMIHSSYLGYSKTPLYSKYSRNPFDTLGTQRVPRVFQLVTVIP
jgi:hypothetical protein